MYKIVISLILISISHCSQYENTKLFENKIESGSIDSRRMNYYVIEVKNDLADQELIIESKLKASVGLMTAPIVLISTVFIYLPSATVTQHQLFFSVGL